MKEKKIMIIQIVWIVAAAGSAWVIAALFSGLDVGSLIYVNWQWGLLGSAAVGSIVVQNVLSQPRDRLRTGIGYVIDVLWPGLVYGVVDALLLSVFPVLAVYEGLHGAMWTLSAGLALRGAIALLASLCVALVYHLGYREFRNKRVLWAVGGNGVFTLAYLLTGSVLAAIIPHAAIHIATVTFARRSAGQVPPPPGEAVELHTQLDAATPGD